MDPIASEKRTAMFRFQLLQKKMLLFRFLEASALVLAAVKFSAHFPAAGDVIRHAIPVVLGPRFLFLIANAIVLSLILSFNLRHVSSATADDEICSVFAPPAVDACAEEVAACEDKNVCEESATSSAGARPRVPRTYRRSRSERMHVQRRRVADLRRSETSVRKEKEEDADEFRRTIEAFIEKQLRRFEREEKMAIVCTDLDAKRRMIDDRGLTCSVETEEEREK